MNIINIFAPRYSTNDILVATHKISKGDNYIRITKDSSYKGKLLKIKGEDTLQFGTQPNGRCKVRVIPIIAFEVIKE